LDALGQGLERRSQVAAGPLRPGDDRQAGDHRVALDRRRDGEEREHRSGFQHPRDVLLGPRAELPDARTGHGQGHEDARHAGRDRSLPLGHGRDGGDARRRRPGKG
jgi:hypothetical protein